MDFGFGTAHLYGSMGREASDRLLDAALAAGFTRLDTAPSYGYGASEDRVGSRRGRAFVTTKVGLEPAAPPSPLRRAAGRGLGPLRAAARRGLPSRGPTMPGPDEPTGRFAVAVVRASVERSLRRLGHLDRLLLHEVAPADVDDDLLALLVSLRDRGDVSELGVATAGPLTAAVLARGAGVLTVAQFAAGPVAGSPVLPHRPHRVVGHGMLGPGGRDLRLARAVLAADADLRDRWAGAVQGTRWDGAAGTATALLQRSHRLDLDEAVVATSRAAALPELRRAIRTEEITAERWSLLDELVGAVRAMSGGASRGPGSSRDRSRRATPPAVVAGGGGGSHLGDQGGGSGI